MKSYESALILCLLLSLMGKSYEPSSAMQWVCAIGVVGWLIIAVLRALFAED